jgi:hypothetical protein
MVKTRDNNIVLDADESIQFPNSQISHSESGGLTISGTTNVDVVSIGGIPIDDTDKADGRVLQYDQASNTIKYVDRPT